MHFVRSETSIVFHKLVSKVLSRGINRLELHVGQRLLDIPHARSYCENPSVHLKCEVILVFVNSFYQALHRGPGGEHLESPDDPLIYRLNQGCSVGGKKLDLQTVIMYISCMVWSTIHQEKHLKKEAFFS